MSYGQNLPWGLQATRTLGAASWNGQTTKNNSGYDRFNEKQPSRISLEFHIAQKVGHKAALLFEKIRYWTTTSAGKVIDGKRWIYNTYKEWSDQLKIPIRTLQRYVQKLKEEGLILVGNFNKKKSDRTNWYTVSEEVAVPYGQVGGITTNRLTTNSLNVLNAHARETMKLFCKEEKEQIKEIVEIEKVNTAPPPFGPNTTLQEDTSSPTDDELEEVIQALEPITTQLDIPLAIDKSKLKNTIKKRMKTHFGMGRRGIERFREYCTTIANNAFLMGKKAMKSGKLFVLSIGFILSEKMIEASWEGSGYFNVYPPKKQSPVPIQEDEMGERAAPIELPAINLDEVCSQSESDFDRVVKTKLYHSMEETTYKSWIQGTGFVAKGIDSRGEPEFEINSRFARDHILTHHESELKRAFQKGLPYLWENSNQNPRVCGGLKGLEHAIIDINENVLRFPSGKNLSEGEEEQPINLETKVTSFSKKETPLLDIKPLQEEPLPPKMKVAPSQPSEGLRDLLKNQQHYKQPSSLC
jgi:hypothetical protein